MTPALLAVDPFLVLLVAAVLCVLVSFTLGALLRFWVNRWRERRPTIRKAPPRDPW